MARIINAEEFRKIPVGTVFCFGEKWVFGKMLILSEHISGDGYWGFWAVDPFFPDSDEPFEVMEAAHESGSSFALETASTKYMDYDGDKMDVFMVLDENDWRRIDSLTNFSG